MSASPACWLALVAAVERLALTQTLEDVIAVVRDSARAISGADGVTFVLRDGENCHYVEEDAVGPLWKGRRFPLTACISGWCMLHDERAVIPDIYVDPRIPHDAYRPTFVKSLVMMPIKTTQPIAAIGSYWAQQRSFNDGEIELLEALARSASAAIATAQMREALRESEARLNVALTAGALGTWEFDLANESFSASQMTKSVFGFAPETPLTRETVRAAVHPNDLDAVRLAFALAIRDGVDIRAEFRNCRPDGSTRWISMRGRAVRDANGTAARLSGVCGDVTERHEARERTGRLQSELAHVGRLTEMGQMTSAFAHELRQPLTAANNYLSTAKRSLPDGSASDTRATDLIEKAIGQFQRADEIIRRIGRFVKNTESAAFAEDVGRLIFEASELAQLDAMHRDVTVSIDIADGLPPAYVDKVQIQQVLLNLLRNAFEAMDGSAVRAVAVRARPAEADGQIEISVTDSGPGLAPEVAARLFQPFVTTKDAGMGVGLSICRGIVENHGGRMWAQSDPGHGAAFLFTVPAAKET